MKAIAPQLRIVGLLMPVLLPIAGFCIDEYLYENFIQSPWLAAFGLLITGILSGALLRTWWSIIYAPAITVFLWLVAVFTLFEGLSDERLTVAFFVAIVITLPLAAGAAFGRLVIERINQNRACNFT